MDNLLHWIWLSLSVNPGGESFKKLYERFGSVGEIYSADEAMLASVIGSRSRDFKSLLDKDLERAQGVLDFCLTKSVGILVYEDEKYPENLRKIKNPPVLLRHGHKARILQFLLCISLGSHGFYQTVPGIGSKAHTEGGENVFVHTAAKGIVQGFRTGWRIQLAVEKPGRFLVKRPQPFLLTVFALVLLILRHLHTAALCQGSHRIWVAQSLQFHYKIDGTAALVTAEAVIDALIRGNGEGGRLFSVEGTQAKQICTGSTQIHPLSYHILNGIAGQ